MLKFSFASIGIAAAAACCLGLAAFAAAPPPAKPPAQAPKNILSTPDDPAKVEAARQFIKLYHPNTDPEVASRLLNEMMPKIVANRKKGDPKVDVKKFEQEVRKRALTRASANLQLQSRVVSHHFTLPELKALAAFFASPLGRKLVKETPFIKRDMRLLHREMNQSPHIDLPSDGNSTLAKPSGKPPANPPAKEPAKPQK
ncbi:MAG TPA: DUF2059 domain-containing protein [Rhizomicrobium sp.]|jgi:hypothetical protein|nr:DUF2059 domain-containing protein [Rhizomicrobium sp.]